MSLRPVIAVAAALALPACAQAAEVPVTTTIQAAVDAANNGDTITIPAKTYTEVVSTNKQLTFAAAPGAVLVNPSDATKPTLTFTGTAGDTVRDLIVVSSVGDAVSVGGGTTSIQRSQLFSLAKGKSALAATSGTGDPKKTVIVDSSVLSGPISVDAAYTSPTVAGGGIDVQLRHVTAVGNVVADASGAPTLGATPITVTFLDSILRGTQVPVTATGTVGATITADPARNSVAKDASDAGSLFVAPGAFNYHLRADAPVIDKGQTTTGESDTDIDGDPRTVGTASDYGADEFVNQAPKAALAQPARAVRQNIPATFDASGSSDPEARTGGGIATYHWDFGDGSTADTSTPTTTHTYAQKQAYSVTVTVTDRQGRASAPSDPVSFTVIDGTPPTVTIGQPGVKQRIPLYGKARKGRRPARKPVTFFGGAQDDVAMGKVYLALRAVAVKNGQCKWFDGKSRMVTASCGAPTILTPAFLSGGWRYRLPIRARLPRGPYVLVAVAVDASGLPSATQSVSFRFR